jgi:exodeoxyribonuclease VII small subunit
VERLETEALSLEETVDLYEQAMELARVANRMLDEAEMKVKVLAQQRDGTFVPVDLDLDQPV